MMSMDKQKRLVTRLLERTKNGELEWKESADGEGFIVSFKDNSVRIRRVQRKNTIDYEVALLNEEGREVDTFVDPELDSEGDLSNPWYVAMKDLHESARKTALGSEKILDEILGELDDDEIPF